MSSSFRSKSLQSNHGKNTAGKFVSKATHFGLKFARRSARPYQIKPPHAALVVYGIICFFSILGTPNTVNADRAHENEMRTSELHGFSSLMQYLNFDNSRKPHHIPLDLESQFFEPRLFPSDKFIIALTRTIEPSWRPIYQENLRYFASNFLIEDRCLQANINTPKSLLEVTSQIEHIAKASQQQLLMSLSSKDWRWIRKHSAKLQKLVKKQIANQSLSRREKATFRKFRSKFDSADQKSIKCSLNTWRQLTNETWLKNLRSLLASHPNAQHKIIMRVDTALGSIIFGGQADKRLYEKNVLFMASLGGNDFYGIESTLVFNGIPQLLVDFEGDDRYQSSKPGGISSGVGKISILIDFKGNDHYLTNAFSLGAGLLGYGLLVDLEGKDQYESSLLSQGFGYFGNGQIIDLNGDDLYKLAGLGQGIGFSAGLGSLYDSKGNDTYSATGFAPSSYGTPGIFEAWSQGVGIGFRSTSSGGIGILTDQSGNDIYTAGSFSQGGGYFYGLGILVDKGVGSDIYIGSRYHLAWSAHTGLGLFYDEGGDDIYSSIHSAGAGASWDRSISTFIDGGGDDQYSMGEFSYGSSAHHSISIFLDSGGKDLYRHKFKTESFKGLPNLSIKFRSTIPDTKNSHKLGAILCKQAESDLFILNLGSDPIETLFEQNIISMIKHQCPNAIKQD